MSLSLQEVVAPLEKAEFLSLLRARSLMFRRSSGQAPFKGLFDWTAEAAIKDRLIEKIKQIPSMTASPTKPGSGC